MGKHSVAVGDQAPDFALPAQDGREVSLSELLRESSVVLYFYPKDDTPGCTTEACGFRDNYEVFKDAGAEVVGVSSDSVASHREFADKRRLPFILLSDKGGRVRKEYGVGRSFGVPGRVTYVIDRDGVVRHIFESQLRAMAHIDAALKTIKSLDWQSKTAPSPPA